MTKTNTNLNAEKSLIRQEMRQRRKIYHKDSDQATVEQKLQEHLDKLQISHDKIIAGYLAKGSEINITPLLKTLIQKGYQVCLPAVQLDNPHLIFREWTGQTPLTTDAANILTPTPDAKILEPDVFLIPLLAFDNSGRRLGQGMGYYDATLRRLSHDRQITVIGITYESQKIETVPTNTKDYNMDMVITDKNIYRFNRNNAL